MNYLSEDVLRGLRGDYEWDNVLFYRDFSLDRRIVFPEEINDDECDLLNLMHTSYAEYRIRAKIYELCVDVFDEYINLDEALTIFVDYRDRTFTMPEDEIFPEFLEVLRLRRLDVAREFSRLDAFMPHFDLIERLCAIYERGGAKLVDRGTDC